MQYFSAKTRYFPFSSSRLPSHERERNCYVRRNCICTEPKGTSKSSVCWSYKDLPPTDIVFWSPSGACGKAPTCPYIIWITRLSTSFLMPWKYTHEKQPAVYESQDVTSDRKTPFLKHSMTTSMLNSILCINWPKQQSQRRSMTTEKRTNLGVIAPIREMNSPLFSGNLTLFSGKETSPMVKIPHGNGSRRLVRVGDYWPMQVC